MKQRSDPDRRIGVRILAVVVVAAVALWVTASPVRAACDGDAPPFDPAVAQARLIVIGEVVRVTEHEMTLRVDHVVKGSAPATLDIFGLFLHPCAGPLSAVEGDVIAIAFGVGEFEGLDVNPIAYLEGVPYREDIPLLTIAEVFELAGVPVPDTSIPSTSPLGWLVPVGLLLVTGSWISMLAAGRRTDR